MPVPGRETAAPAPAPAPEPQVATEEMHEEPAVEEVPVSNEEAVSAPAEQEADEE